MLRVAKAAWLAGAMAAATMVSVPAQADVKTGVDAWTRGDFATAARLPPDDEKRYPTAATDVDDMQTMQTNGKNTQTNGKDSSTAGRDAPNKDNDIIHDAEYYILEAQNKENWLLEDSEVDAKLKVIYIYDNASIPEEHYIDTAAHAQAYNTTSL